MERGSMCRPGTRYMGLGLAKAPHHSLRVKFPSDFSPVQGPSPRPREVIWSLPCCCLQRSDHGIWALRSKAYCRANGSFRCRWCLLVAAREGRRHGRSNTRPIASTLTTARTGHMGQGPPRRLCTSNAMRGIEAPSSIKITVTSSPQCKDHHQVQSAPMKRVRIKSCHTWQASPVVSLHTALHSALWCTSTAADGTRDPSTQRLYFQSEGYDRCWISCGG